MGQNMMCFHNPSRAEQLQHSLKNKLTSEIPATCGFIWQSLRGGSLKCNCGLKLQLWTGIRQKQNILSQSKSHLD